MGNWKMNGRQANNEALLSALKPAVAGFDTIDVAVCPPFPYLSQTASQLADSNITFGAQNLSAQQDGAYTGEVSSGMLVDLKVRWVLVGHSERRSLYGETDEIVAAKTQVALDAGLIPVICIGETLEERKTGDTEVVLARQLDAVQAAVAVHVRGDLDGADQGEPAAGGDGDVVHAHDRGHAERVASHLVQGLVPTHGGDTEQLDRGIAPGEHHGDRIIVPRVAVEQNLSLHLCLPSPPSASLRKRLRGSTLAL